MWDLVSHVSHIIPGNTFGSDIILGRDNSLHKTLKFGFKFGSVKEIKGKEIWVQVVVAK